MTMTNASSAVRGRRAKFTPQAMEKIKEFVEKGSAATRAITAIRLVEYRERAADI